MNTAAHPLLARRTSGVLLHITSLPGQHGSGDLGPAARHFVDWLASAGQSIWQILPHSPAGPGNSPYQSVSAFAGSPLMVDDVTYSGTKSGLKLKAGGDLTIGYVTRMPSTNGLKLRFFNTLT
jgi:4-alpha-glucanotransferase